MEKKDKKSIKTLKETKTKEKKILKKENENDVVCTKETKKFLKIISIVAVFFATMCSLIVFIFGVITTLAIAGNSKEDLLSNNTVITFVSRMNNYSISDAEASINGMGNRLLFIIFEVVVPAIALICAMLLIIYLTTRILNYVNNISKEKDIFTKKKYQEAKDIISILSTILFVTFLIFDKPSFVFYLLIELLSVIVIYLYRKIVNE